jgi:multimeric flavodoxin WrbA
MVGMVAEELQAVAGRREEALELETLYLGHLEVEMCRGCRLCFDRGEDACPLKDDLPAIRAKMDAADAIIFASPVYVDDVSGIAKNWMDRLAYVCHRPAFGGKCAYLIATVADSPTSHTLRTMSMGVRTWGFHIVGQAGFKMGALMDGEEMERRYRGEAAGIAEALFDAVARKGYLRPSFFSLMIFKIQQRAWQQESPHSLDYAYWKGQGWFERECEFYVDHEANPLKVALARLAGSVIGRFVA